MTTNYTYELEQAALHPGKISKSKIKAMMHHTEGSKIAEGKYLLHTYNRAVVSGHHNRIWHIHGEARKPDSMILGHYYYGKLLRRCVARIDGTKEITEDKKPAYHGKEKEFTRNIKAKRSQKILPLSIRITQGTLPRR